MLSCFTLRHDDGSFREVNGAAAAYLRPDGHSKPRAPSVSEGVAHDQALMTAVLDGLPDPALIVSADPYVLAANPPALALLPALRLGDPLARALRAPDVLDCVARVARTARAETVAWLERVPTERLFEVNIASIAVTGSVRPLLLILRDLTEARRVERMRSDFVANASHELRTPLASLLGFIETLQGPARDDAPARQKFLTIMREQGQRMARLVDDLLSLSRIEQNLHIQPATAVDFALVVRHVADTLGPLARDNGIDLRLDVEDNVIVAGDRDELVRVGENLIENAIKYGSAENGIRSVEVSLKREGQDVVLDVRDHGPGIAPEHIPRLTERFYRIDTSQSRAKGGTGLGLAIVKHIVARHRGRLTIASVLGDGSRVAVSIPAIV